jgi:hypothetical protein
MKNIEKNKTKNYRLNYKNCRQLNFDFKFKERNLILFNEKTIFKN